ncbi:hypothetical protein M3Y94_00168900 [Aphelenchoides besseyi]|nr:hypothetical protein M3Y94_00168900 [Aphelenchoides besseyi]KAI6236996.1 hypothetical protein M3Y95_00218500 [Aphelenchoides besseyi]
MCAAKNTSTDDSQHPTEGGFGDKMPADMVKSVQVEGTLEKGERLGVLISKAMLVLRVESPALREKLKICDYIIAVNNQPITRKDVFYEIFSKLKKTGGTFVISIQRPIWSLPTERVVIGGEPNEEYSYLRALFILYPGSCLGMSVKGCNGKVYFTSVEPNSIAGMACLIGDCVVELNGEEIHSTSAFTSRITKSLKSHKIAVLTLERPINAIAVNTVRAALLAEKNTLFDSRLAPDAAKIGEEIARQFLSGHMHIEVKSILRSANANGQNPNRRVTVLPNCQDVTIGGDPFNPIFLQQVKKGDELRIGQVNAPNSNSAQRRNSKENCNNQSFEAEK